eukprot:scaffold135140_cov65-Phaeocystis_antarctica.AAC.1
MPVPREPRGAHIRGLSRSAQLYTTDTPLLGIRYCPTLSPGPPPLPSVGAPQGASAHCRCEAASAVPQLMPFSRHAELVVAVLRDVADPRKRLVAALLDDLEVADLDPRDGEVGDLELDGDRRLVLLVLLVAHARQTKVRSHQVLLAAVELLDAPDDGVALRSVLDCPDGGLERGRVGVRWHRDEDLYVVGRAALLELRLGLDHVLDAAVRVRLDDSLDPDQRLHLRAEAIAHQLELAVGRDERDGAVILEAREADALMELDILHLHRLAL